MSTTEMIIEQLIGGIQALFWFVCIFLTVFGYEWINIQRLTDFSTGIIFIAICFAYPLGIIVDEAADFIFEKWSISIRDKRFTEMNINPDDQMATAFILLSQKENEFLGRYLSYLRSRIRLCRLTVVNSVIVTLILPIFLWSRLKYDNQAVVFVIFSGLFVASLAVWGWYRVSDNFAKKIASLYQNRRLIE
jgi:hypothetical protein